MATITRSITIQAPVAKVYDFVTRPQNLPQIWPNLIEVRNVKRSADGAHSFDWTYKMAGIKFRGHADATEVVPNKGHVARNVKGIPSTFIWTYEGQGDMTRVTVEVEYSIPGRVLRALSERFIHRLNERDAEALLANLKARMEYGLEEAAGTQEEAPTVH